MDDTVNDFLNEINEITPMKANKKSGEVWEQCFDKLTGYSYYWNTKTNAVTWTAPSSYVQSSSSPHKKIKPPPKRELYIPPKISTEFGSVTFAPAQVKIYSIQQNLDQPKPIQTSAKKNSYSRRHSESDDEKIELITSYGGDSDSESEQTSSSVKEQSQKADNVESDDDDNIDILTKIQQRAKELRELENSAATAQKRQDTELKKTTAGISLVAGYNSDSDSGNELPVVKADFPVNKQADIVQQKSQSTLFPISQPVNISDFADKNKSPVVENKDESNNIRNIHNKAFKRKKRIGISLINTVKKNKSNDNVDPNSERKGFGYSDASQECTDASNESKNKTYGGFTKGGVLFANSDEQLPSASNKTQLSHEATKVEDTYNLLTEKLVFLTEGHEAVIPVQAMLIQAETLFTAMKNDALKISYLEEWLDDTCSELAKLEKEAAPDGWLLEWDRSNKRYYYRNPTNGASQWEFPQEQPAPPAEEVSATHQEQDMDISMTPPHPSVQEPEVVDIVPSPPLPPTIKSPTPPPPPIISMDDSRTISAPLPPSPPLLPPPPPLSIAHNNGEPLPPGVDFAELSSFHEQKPPVEDKKQNDSLSSVLDSFYSEIADVSNNSPVGESVTTAQTESIPQTSIQHQSLPEAAKKKKKTKVKLSTGLSMKNKGVSQLVEKWKNVQKTYND